MVAAVRLEVRRQPGGGGNNNGALAVAALTYADNNFNRHNDNDD